MNLQTDWKSCCLVKSYDATGKFSARFGSLSMARTLSPSSLHALLKRQEPAKISKTSPEPFLGLPSKSVWLSGEVSCMDCELQKLSQATDVVCRACSHSKLDAPGKALSRPDSTSWTVSASPGATTCQAALHFAAPCPAFKHFMQSCIPKRHRPALTGLLQPFDMLKCQHKGLPASVFLFKPDSSSGNWGTGFSPGLIRFAGFLGPGVGFPPSLSSGLFWGWTLSLGIAIKCTFMRGSCINLSNNSSRGGATPTGAFKEPLKSEARIENISRSALMTCVKVIALKLDGASETNVDMSLSSHFWHTDHERKPTMSNAKCRLCSAKYNLSSVLVSMSCKPDTTVCFNAPCSSVIIVFDLFFDSVCTSFSLEWHLLGCTYTMFPLSTML